VPEITYILLTRDNDVKELTVTEPSLPAIGDGKFFSKVGYEVKAVVTNLVSRKNPLVLAEEC
jgi:hypothetical protein